MKITALWMCVLLVGCSQGSSTSGSSESNVVKSSNDVPPEALAAAKDQILDAGFQKCGEVWGAFHPKDYGMGDTEMQVKGLKMEVDKNRLPPSEADKLNGIGWQGLVKLDAEASRTRPKGEKKWSDWHPGFSGGINALSSLVEVKNEWKVPDAQMLGWKAFCPTE